MQQHFKLFLQFLLLGHWCIGQFPPILRPSCSLVSEPDIVINCNNINNEEDVNMIRKTLEQGRAWPDDDPPISVNLDMSFLNILSPELLTTYNVTNLSFSNCRMTKMPYDLLCADTVRMAGFLNTRIPGFKLTPQGFKTCNKLQNLVMDNMSLLLIPPGSFEGLNSLKELRIVNNQVALIPDFSGLEDSLETLTLGFNPINFIPSNAFQNLKKLKVLNLMNANITAIQDGAFDVLGPKTQVILSGNPLKCDCTLNWLKEWLKQHPVDNTEMAEIPYCATPVVGPIMDLNFCNKTTPAVGGSTQGNGNILQFRMILTISCVLVLIFVTFQ